MASPFSEDLLSVGGGHHLYFAQYGRKDAAPTVVIHGGPGSASRSTMLDWFDLTQHRVVLYDQRGCGKSMPPGELQANTTQDLIADIERLRIYLQISAWHVVGGSWGAMLAVLYAGMHPQATNSVVLRGVFLPGKAQLDWFFHDLQALVPEAWADLTRGMDADESGSVLSALTERLHLGTEAERADTAHRWSNYENAVMRAMAGNVDDSGNARHSIEPRLLDKYRLQSHYLSQSCFTTESAIFDAASQIAAPVIFVHGTHDWICPPANLVRLSAYIPQAQLRWVPRGTHTPADPLILNALRTAIQDRAA